MKNTKIVNIVSSDKGGVGKSTYAKTFLEISRKKLEKEISAFDCDVANKGLSSIYSEDNNALTGVECIDIFNTEQRDEVLNRLAVSNNDALIDLPAGGLVDLLEIVGNEDKLIRILGRINYKINMHLMVTHEVETINSLNSVYGIFGDRVAYTIVFNLGMMNKSANGKNTAAAYHGMHKIEGYESVYPEISKGDYKEFFLPEMPEYLMTAIREHKIPFLEFENTDKYPATFMDFCRVEEFTFEAEEGIRKLYK